MTGTAFRGPGTTGAAMARRDVVGQFVSGSAVGAVVLGVWAALAPVTSAGFPDTPDGYEAAVRWGPPLLLQAALVFVGGLMTGTWGWIVLAERRRPWPLGPDLERPAPWPDGTFLATVVLGLGAIEALRDHLAGVRWTSGTGETMLATWYPAEAALGILGEAALVVVVSGGLVVLTSAGRRHLRRYASDAGPLDGALGEPRV